MESERRDLCGKFIVFEGLDGSGTSTQARLLQETLIKNGYEAFLTSEPTQGPVGNIIKLTMSHRLLFSENPDIDDRQLAYLFAADRYDHLYNSMNGIIRNLSKGAVVISTRYYLSSYAYHCRNDEDLKIIKRLNLDFPPADKTFFIDCPVETCINRIMISRDVPEKYENIKKLEIVRNNYLKIIKELESSNEIHILNGSLDPDILHTRILSIIKGQENDRNYFIT